MNKSKKGKRQTFMMQTQAILKEEGYKKECYPLNALVGTIAMNEANARRKVFFYKWSGLFLLISIPLISALLSFAISSEDSSGWRIEAIVPALSLTLTFLTILNSILRPGERFVKACKIGIEIEEFKSDFLIDLERMEHVETRHTVAFRRSALKFASKALCIVLCSRCPIILQVFVDCAEKWVIR